MADRLDPSFYYFVGSLASLYFLRWLWLKLYPPQIPDEWRNNASIEKADQAITKVKEFIESIARGEQEVSLTLAEEELNAICKIKKSIYHFSITENKLFAYELKGFYVTSTKGCTLVVWEISFSFYYDDYFKRDMIVEDNILISLKGGMFDIIEKDCYPEYEKLFLSQGKLAKVIFGSIVNRESREQGIPINYIKQIEIKDDNLIFFA